MLTRLKKDETERLQSVLNVHSDSNVRVSALIKAYGVGQAFFNVWHQNFDTVVARLEGSFFICEGENTDFEEIAFFLNFNPYFRHLMGKADTIEKILPFFTGGYERCLSDFLALRVKKPDDLGELVIDSAPSLKDVFSVMEKVQSDGFTIGDFTSWYADVSHRIRHGCARAYLLKSGGLPASTCLVSAESDSAGLLSGVSTSPEFRGHGFAAAVVGRACLDLTGCGKLPVLECLPSLTRHYGKLGFEKIGAVEQLNLV